MIIAWAVIGIIAMWFLMEMCGFSIPLNGFWRFNLCIAIGCVIYHVVRYIADNK